MYIPSWKIPIKEYLFGDASDGEGIFLTDAGLAVEGEAAFAEVVGPGGGLIDFSGGPEEAVGVEAAELAIGGAVAAEEGLEGLGEEGFIGGFAAVGGVFADTAVLPGEIAPVLVRGEAPGGAEGLTGLLCGGPGVEAPVVAAVLFVVAVAEGGYGGGGEVAGGPAVAVVHAFGGGRGEEGELEGDYEGTHDGSIIVGGCSIREPEPVWCGRAE